MNKPTKSLLKFTFVILLFGFYLTSNAECNEDTIKSVSTDGSTVILIDGSVWEVSTIDRVDTMLWLTADDVLICDDNTIINKDENAEKANVERLN